MSESIKAAALSSLCIYFTGIQPLQAQDDPGYGEGLKINIDNRGNYYIRFMLWNQIWARVTEHNPGTLINNVLPEKAWMPWNRMVTIGTWAGTSSSSTTMPK